MPLTYEQMVSVLNDFESQNPILSANANVHGFHLEIVPGNSKKKGELDAYAFEIRVHVATPLSAATMRFVPIDTIAGLGTSELLTGRW